MFLARSVAVGNRIVDLFDRANSNLTTPWTTAGTALPIVSNECGLFTTQFNQSLYGLAIHDEFLATADQAVEFRRGTATWVSGTTSALFGWTHANAGLTTGAAMVLTLISAANVQLTIYTPTAYNTYGSARATSASFAASASDTFTMKNVGNVFTCYHNGVSRVSWTDTGGVVNLANNRVAFGSQASNGFSSNCGVRALDWTAYDLAA